MSPNKALTKAVSSPDAICYGRYGAANHTWRCHNQGKRVKANKKQRRVNSDGPRCRSFAPSHRCPPTDGRAWLHEPQVSAFGNAPQRRSLSSDVSGAAIGATTSMQSIHTPRTAQTRFNRLATTTANLRRSTVCESAQGIARPPANCKASRKKRSSTSLCKSRGRSWTCPGPNPSTGANGCSASSPSPSGCC